MEGVRSRPELRYERKFVTRGDPRDVFAIIRTHPAHFREIHSARTVHNIYLDTIDRRAFHDNVAGIDRRQKTRVRWYGDRIGIPEQMTLELKKRLSLVGYKESSPLAPFEVGPGFSLESLREAFDRSSLSAEIQLHLAELELALLNQYERKYFVSRDGSYRVTVDWNLAFWRLGQGRNALLGRFLEPEAVVVELKYSADEDSGAHRLSELFPFRLSRNSKYVAGIQATCCGVSV